MASESRGLIATSAKVAGVLALLGPSRAAATRTTAGFAPVIDGNLVAPIDASARMDPTTRAQVRSSGLTAFKQTLGGSGNCFKAQTDVEIADFRLAA
jgi:membrane dipeptidase